MVNDNRVGDPRERSPADPERTPRHWPEVTAGKLEHGMRLGADWLVEMQEAGGRFRYWYHPVDDKFSGENADNFLRQAGTSFALTSVFEMTGDRRHLRAGRKSVEHLLNFMERLDSDKAYFLFRGKAKLGGISLPMLTMLQLRRLTGTVEFDSVLVGLANMIMFLQERYNTGQYKSTYVYRGDYDHERHSGWESRIYPGEALCALAGMYRTFQERRYKASMDWALDFYSGAGWLSHAFLPWTISAFASLYEQAGDRKYADYVFLLCDHMLTEQNAMVGEETCGSFHGSPSVNTASYLEGLADGIQVARLMEDSERLRLYQERGKMGYRWLFGLQYEEAEAATLARPEMARGGFRKSLTDARLRIDNTQHAISSFAKGLRVIYGVAPAVHAGSAGV